MLNQCARNFRKLLDCEVHITFNQSNRCNKICINFVRTDFFHLAGLHKLKDIPMIGNKIEIFEKVSKSKKYCNKLSKSIYYKDIQTRIELLSNLGTILRGNFEMFPFKINNAAWTKIKADYLIRYFYKGHQCFLFIKNRNGKYYVCNSIIQDKRHFHRGLR